MGKKTCPSESAFLPCCSEKVVVTGRASKMAERPRYHHCKKCGKQYAIDRRNGGMKVLEL